MSRIGRQPIKIPDGVEASVNEQTLTIKGPKGELTRTFDKQISVAIEDGQISFRREADTIQGRSLHGLSRALANGMVEGVTKGFEKRLEVVGVSYQASVEGGKRLKLMVGFSHPVYLDIPKGIEVECPTAIQIQVRGCDKQAVGEFAARVRRARPPEPYKGKGVRYLGEQIIQKAGKSFVGGEK